MLRKTNPNDECAWLVLTQCGNAKPETEWFASEAAATTAADKTLAMAAAEDWGPVGVWVLRCLKQSNEAI